MKDAEVQNEKYDLRSLLDLNKTFNRFSVGIKLTRGYLMDSELRQWVWMNSRFSGLQILCSRFVSCQWIEVEIKDSEFKWVSFDQCSFRKVHFSGDFWKSLQFKDCLFEDCTFDLNPEEMNFLDCVFAPQPAEVISKENPVEIKKFESPLKSSQAVQATGAAIGSASPSAKKNTRFEFLDL